MDDLSTVSGRSVHRAIQVVAALSTMVGLLAAGSSVFAATPKVSCVFGATPTCSGMTILGAHAGDSLFTSTTVDGQSADVFSVDTTDKGNPTSYIYLGVTPSSGLLTGNPTTIYATVDYYNKNTTSGVTCSTTAMNCGMLINYNSSVGTGIAAAYANATPILNDINGSGAWTTQVFTLSNIKFTGAENNNADLRLAGSAGIAVHSIQLSVAEPTAASTTTTIPSTTNTTKATTSSSTTSSSRSLPKTGESALVPLADAVLAGVGLLLTFRRRTHNTVT